MANNKRRNFFIKKGFQIRYIFMIYSVVSIVIIGLTFGIYFFGKQDLWAGSQDIYSKLQRVNSLNDLILKTAIYVAIGSLITSLILIIVRFLFVSHRLAGPLYRFEVSLKKMRSGDFSFRIKLRKKDEPEMKKLAEEFNQTLDYLNDTFSSIYSRIDKIYYLAENTVGIDKIDGDEHWDNISDIYQEATRIRNFIDSLRIQSSDKST